MRSKDKVEKHFDAPRALDKRFKETLAKSEFSTQSEFFRFKMRELVDQSRESEKDERFEGLKRKRRPPRDKSHPYARRGRRDE